MLHAYSFFISSHNYTSQHVVKLRLLLLYYYYILEGIYADLIQLDLSSNSSRISPQVMQKVFECSELFQDYEKPSLIPGGPAFEISPFVIESLMNLQFTTFDIALILGVSRSTVNLRGTAGIRIICHHHNYVYMYTYTSCVCMMNLWNRLILLYYKYAKMSHIRK